MKRRDFPRIRLAPWEHLQNPKFPQVDERAQNVVPFEWHGRQYEVAARFADCGDGMNYVFARFVGEASEDEGNWVISNGTSDNFPEQHYGPTRLELSRRLGRGNHKRHFPFGRLFHIQGAELGVAQPQRVFIDTNGLGHYLPIVGEEQGSYEPFLLPVQRHHSLRAVSARDVLALSLAEAKRSESDARFALDWLYKNAVQRENLVVRTERGSLDELRRVLTCALQMELLVQSRDIHWGWNVQTDDSTWESVLSDTAQWTEEVDLPMRLRIWKRVALTYFAPSIWPGLLKSHRCVRQSSLTRSGLVSVHTQTPTQHERLEAVLFLRDWARDKISPRKLQLLLGHM